MTRGLRRYQQSHQTHFVTFSCYDRRPGFRSPATYNLFLTCLEEMRQRFDLRIYGYVVMPEHVHLLISEPKHKTLAGALHFLKLSFSKRLPKRKAGFSGPFWQARYYDRNVRDAEEFQTKLHYLHRNPVKRGLVRDPTQWEWSSFRHYASREKGPVEIESEWTAVDRETGGAPRIFLSPWSSTGPG